MTSSVSRRLAPLVHGRVAPLLRLSWLRALLRLSLRRYRLRLSAVAAMFALVALALIIGLGEWRVRPPAVDLSSKVELVAFLHDDLSEPGRQALAKALGALPGIASVRLLSSDETLARLRAELAERAGMLDGVEEGFLPATLEVALLPNEVGAGRADALAWRLRRMEGVADVDLVRSSADARLGAAAAQSADFRRVGLFLAAVIASLALVGGFGVIRSTRRDALVFVSLGFTARAVALPIALLSAGAAVLGTGVAVALCRLASVWGGAKAHMNFDFRWEIGGGSNSANTLIVGVSLCVLGGLLGWWGARPSARQLETLRLS